MLTGTDSVCCVDGCVNKPWGYPTLLFTPSKVVPHRQRIHARLDKSVCYKCAEEIQPESLLTETGWRQVQANCMSMHVTMPKRELTEIRWEPIDEIHTVEDAIGEKDSLNEQLDNLRVKSSTQTPDAAKD